MISRQHREGDNKIGCVFSLSSKLLFFVSAFVSKWTFYFSFCLLKQWLFIYF
ncbi:unnamed protein product [Arabidopsis halleri]